MAILASLPSPHHNLFSSLPKSPPQPPLQTPQQPPKPPPPIPIPKYPPKPKPQFTKIPRNRSKNYKPISQNVERITPVTEGQNRDNFIISEDRVSSFEHQHPSFTKIPANRSKYYKPMSRNGERITPIKEGKNRDNTILGEDGVSPFEHQHPSFTKIPHNRTKYYKPISPNTQKITPITEGENREIIIGEDGVSYVLPNAPFEYKFSYSEVPKAKPLAIREPPFLPFAPPSMPRPWTGKAPLMSKKEKEMKKRGMKIPLLDHFGQSGQSGQYGVGGGKRLEMGRVVEMGEVCLDNRSREEILGVPLSRAEVKALVTPLLSDNRQVNLGRDGLTHNMLELIHSHWKRQKVCKVKCKGVPTVDMDNVCNCLEDKTGGKIIHRSGGVVYLFRGRNYNYRTRPRYPVMLWKPAAPVYPKLIQDAPDGLTKHEADEFRRKGKKLLAICKLAKNGVYISLVDDVRHAFEGSELVKIDCRGLDPSDYKKIGAKLMELVPCVLLSFDEEQILMWRGRDWKSMYHDMPMTILPSTNDDLDDSGKSDNNSDPPHPTTVRSSPRMTSLWQHAIDSNKAFLLTNTNLDPDTLLQKVEEFQTISQAMEHSYPATLISDNNNNQTSNSISDVNISKDDEEFNDVFDDDENGWDLWEEEVESGSLGSLPIDHITRRLMDQ